MKRLFNTLKEIQVANEIQNLITAAAEVGAKASLLAGLNQATTTALSTQSANAAAATAQAATDAGNVGSAQTAEQQGESDLLAAEANFQTAAAAVTALYPSVIPVSPTATP